MSEEGDFLEQVYWHVYLIHDTPRIFIYTLITEFTLVNFGYLTLKPSISVTISEDANENVPFHKTARQTISNWTDVGLVSSPIWLY